MDLKCQIYGDLNRFHAFWADFIFFFREMLANNHVMENDRIDLFEFFVFPTKMSVQIENLTSPKLLRNYSKAPWDSSSEGALRVISYAQVRDNN